jgi:hypothetical protein
MAEGIGRVHVGIELFNLGPSEGTNALIEDWRGDVNLVQKLCIPFHA